MCIMKEHCSEYTEHCSRFPPPALIPKCCKNKVATPQAAPEAGSAEFALLSAEIGPLVAKLAQWERDNGTLACILGPEQKDEVCEIISDWALTGAMRRCDEWIKSGI